MILAITKNEEIWKKVIDWLLTTPKALALLVFSFFSGHLWIFIITTYFKTSKKGNKYLKSIYGKIAVGVIWFTIIDLPIHLFRNGNIIDINNIFDNILYAIMYGLILQGIVFGLIVTLKKEKI